MADTKEGKVRAQDFNLHFWYSTIPMTDDVFLGVQAQNIARVEMSVLRLWEKQVLDEQRTDPGNYQGPKYRELLALSQMWVFGLYEFLRTWRERARELTNFEKALQSLGTQQERDAYLKKIVGEVEERARHVEHGPLDYPKHVAKVGDAAFMKSIRDYNEKIENLWEELSAVRMPAAKHQLPGEGKRKLMAEAPGIGLPSPYTGSIHWMVLVGKGKEKREIGRRELADKFLGLLSWHEDIDTALVLANEDRLRRRRLKRLGRNGKLKPGDPMDEYFPLEPLPYFVSVCPRTY